MCEEKFVLYHIRLGIKWLAKIGCAIYLFICEILGMCKNLS